MIEPPTTEEHAPVPAAVVHVDVERTRIREAMGPAMGEVLAALREQGLSPVGPMFDHQFPTDPDRFDLEVGFPVATAVTPQGRVRAGVQPGGRVVRTVYAGDYERLAEAWGAFDAWIAGQGLTVGGEFWQRFLVGPESSNNPAEWRTELVRPLA